MNQILDKESNIFFFFMKRKLKPNVVADGLLHRLVGLEPATVHFIISISYIMT
jgi:hypothetical protein